jgi:DNA-binding response OmpR family regulator
MTDKSILLVDDDPIIRFAYSRLFTTAGYQVKTAESAEQALEMMRATPAPVLFLDLSLPAMSGVELCRVVRQEWPWSISIAVTGFTSIFEVAACREAGFEDYYTKPVDPKELIAAAKAAHDKLERWRVRHGTRPLPTT